MSSRTSSVSSYTDSVYDAKEAQTTQKRTSGFSILPRRESSDSTRSSSNKTSLKERYPVLGKVAKAWKEHHEGVNAAYNTYYGMGVGGSSYERGRVIIGQQVNSEKSSQQGR